MKSEFSSSWISSKQPRKQHKYRMNAPTHIKRKFLGATLDKNLRSKHGRKSIEVRSGDEVKIMRGKFSGKQGKVSVIDLENSRIQIEGINREKRGGEKIPTWFSPSKVKIMSLNESDAKRLKKNGVSESKKEQPKIETKKMEKGDKKNAHKKK